MISLKRIYEKPLQQDGCRILVDRLWPRGVSKEKAALNLWFKEIAPTDTLRKWFAHDPKKWDAFVKKYKVELAKNPGALQELRKITRANKRVTLVYAAKDQEHNEAIVIKELLERRSGGISQ